MTTSLTASVAAPALGLVAGLELLYWLLRRVLPGFRPRQLYRTFQFLAGGLLAATRSGWLSIDSAWWRIGVSFATLCGAFLLFSLIEAVVLRSSSTGTAAGVKAPPVPKLARDVLRGVLLLVLGFVLAHVVFEVPLDRLTVSSATVVAILGFSLQDVLKNVFAGMTLQLEHAFQRGDWLLWNDTPARVVDMTFRATHLRTTEGHLFVVPNTEVASTRVINLGSGVEPVAVPLFLSLPYSVAPVDAKRALLDAVRSTPGVLESPAPEVLLHQFADSGITYRVRPWSRQQASLSRLQDSLLTRLWYRLQREGISIPYPVRTVRLHNQDRADKSESKRRAMRAEALLAELPLFEELPALPLRALAAFAVERDFDAGEILVREGERGDSLFLISQGQVRVTRTAGDGEVLELAILGPGDFFGERSLLTGELRGATVVALTGCEVFVLDRMALAPLLASDPTLAEALSRALATREAQNVAKLEHQRERGRASDQDVERSFLARIRSFFALPEG